MENTRVQSWNCAFEMLYAVEEQMKRQECYDRYKQSFLNHVLFFLLWNLETLEEWEPYRLFFVKAKNDCTQRFHLDDFEEGYFYETRLYRKYLQLQVCLPEQFLMEQKKEERQKAVFYWEELKQKQWKFPYEKIKRGTKLAIYGAGNVGKDMYGQAIREGYCDVVLWVDKNNQNVVCCDKVIRSADVLAVEEYDLVLIAISNRIIAQEVREILEALHIDPDKIVDMF